MVINKFIFLFLFISFFDRSLSNELIHLSLFRWNRRWCSTNGKNKATTSNSFNAFVIIFEYLITKYDTEKYWEQSVFLLMDNKKKERRCMWRDFGIARWKETNEASWKILTFTAWNSSHWHRICSCLAPRTIQPRCAVFPWFHRSIENESVIPFVSFGNSTKPKYESYHYWAIHDIFVKNDQCFLSLSNRIFLAFQWWLKCSNDLNASWMLQKKSLVRNLSYPLFILLSVLLSQFAKFPFLK